MRQCNENYFEKKSLKFNSSTLELCIYGILHCDKAVMSVIITRFHSQDSVSLDHNMGLLALDHHTRVVLRTRDLCLRTVLETVQVVGVQ